MHRFVKWAWHPLVFLGWVRDDLCCGQGHRIGETHGHGVQSVLEQPRKRQPVVDSPSVGGKGRAALIRAASTTTAMPCWLSCSTGLTSRWRRRLSISKHSGAAESPSRITGSPASDLM